MFLERVLSDEPSRERCRETFFVPRAEFRERFSAVENGQSSYKNWFFLVPWF